MISIWLLPVLIAITLHEAAHGYVAWLLGDDTARRMGRVTFWPHRHIDPVGTVIVPGALLLVGAPFLFGWAKPVPVNFDKLKNPKRDMVWVAVAGPGINLILAFVAALLIHLSPYLPEGQWFFENFRNAVLINLVLAVFNMIPLPPLDGGRVAVGLLPPPLAIALARLERFGLLIVILLLFILPMIGDKIGLDLDLLEWLFRVPVEFLYSAIMGMAGHF